MRLPQPGRRRNDRPRREMFHIRTAPVRAASVRWLSVSTSARTHAVEPHETRPSFRSERRLKGVLARRVRFRWRPRRAYPRIALAIPNQIFDGPAAQITAIGCRPLERLASRSSGGIDMSVGMSSLGSELRPLRRPPSQARRPGGSRQNHRDAVTTKFGRNVIHNHLGSVYSGKRRCSTYVQSGNRAVRSSVSTAHYP